MSAQAARLVLITAPDAACAARIAEALVAERLAAAVNILPGVHSLYRWQGAVRSAEEVLLVAKTRVERLDALAARVSTLHPYEVAGVVALPVAGGSAPYLDWMLEESTG